MLLSEPLNFLAHIHKRISAAFRATLFLFLRSQAWTAASTGYCAKAGFGVTSTAHRIYLVSGGQYVRIVKGNLTELLRAWQHGDAEAAGELFTLAYEELRRQAERFMRRERLNHTLQTTEIVHEAWLRIQASSTLQFRDRRDFFAVASTIMRHLLVEHARKRNAAKRGDGNERVTLDDDLIAEPQPRGIDILALHEALEEFEKIDPARARIVELRFFGGLSIEMTAQVLGRSVRSINRDWFVAKAWLFDRLSDS